MASKLAERFFKRFHGLMRSHGTYALGSGLKADAKGKLTGARRTVHEPVTPDLWDKHLAGTYAIGIVPIRQDNTVVFGAIDIDLYQDFDIKALNKTVQKLKLPLIVCRTKSGGAHCYCFTKNPVPAVIMRDQLASWAIALGHAGVEVFPKQIRLAGGDDPVEDNTGNWINSPYAEGELSTRYALDPKTGDSLLPEQFLDLADKRAVKDAEALAAITVAEIALEGGNDWLGAPPCLIMLARLGFGDWDNNAMFNICVYLRKRYGEGWERYVPHYNETYLESPLTGRDLATIINSINKKSYSYMCKQDPISRVCDKKACRTQEFGVGGLGDDPGMILGELIKLKTDPVTWILDVNGARLEIDTGTLMDQRKFHARVIEELSHWPSLVKPGSWQKLIREKLAIASEVAVPEDATREGQLWFHLGRFCTGRVFAKELDEVMLGKPYTDEKKQLTYFQAADFFQYLQQHRVIGLSEREVWRFLKRKGADSGGHTLKGKKVTLWVVPAFEKQTEAFTVPRVAVPDQM